jgi:hypothetical protein
MELSKRSEAFSEAPGGEGKSNFYPGVGAPSRTQKEKGCQQFFAKTVCGFSFSAGKEQNLGTFTSNKRSDTRNSGWNPSFC